MSKKYQNPVKGHVPCPVCQSESTVHQVGEGKLIATGEPPKNARNIGLKYYHCPKCGNSPASKSVTEYIDSAMNLEVVDGGDLVTEEEALTELLDSVTVTEQPETAEVNNGEVSSTDVTESKKGEETEKKPFNPLFKRVLIGLLVLLALLWAFRKLMPKQVDAEGGEDVATA
ncbi:hypothetical protein [Vibrio sp. SCSIO 43137]|uniref:hypothetical protein n=1 Tax=Vibrio sp. SCSIO 43137 TaxID=3021011 RepID=UPI002308102A|nr:hypothetical protein [Vibrio sp. SCSIO 43137]WCE30112.1 hypothetical protein PK654_02100 [Vibrio sp. SCSIO 43137]